MPPVFAHGRLRLYLLKLLDESPRHGYEVIRLLEERFQGLYAPSAGTVYPRLAKLEEEGLVTHSTEGGRKVYSLTDAGRAELASAVRGDRRAGAGDPRVGLRAGRRDPRGRPRRGRRSAPGDAGRGPAGRGRSRTTPRGRTGRPSRSGRSRPSRAKEESRRAKEEAKAARRQAKAAKDAMESAREEAQRIARQVQEQVQSYSRGGDWQSGLREGLAELSRELGRFGTQPRQNTAPRPGEGPATGPMGVPATPWAPPYRPADEPPAAEAAEPADDTRPPPTRCATWSGCSTASVTTSATRPVIWAWTTPSCARCAAICRRRPRTSRPRCRPGSGRERGQAPVSTILPNTSPRSSCSKPSRARSIGSTVSMTGRTPAVAQKPSRPPARPWCPSSSRRRAAGGRRSGSARWRAGWARWSRRR